MTKAPGDSFRLRRGRPGDLDALVRFEREVFSDPRFAGHVLSRTSFRRLLAAPTATLIVADLDGRIGRHISRHLAGYVLILYRSGSKRARIYSIAVGREFRRRGLARKLVRAAETDAIAHRCNAVRLEVRADDRRAIALYRASGYQPFGRHAGYYGRVDALRFEKPLPRRQRRSRSITHESD